MTECSNCEYHKNRAARWRAEAYKQAGHDFIELPWVGLTEEERFKLAVQTGAMTADWLPFMEAVEAKLKEKNT